jgi:hypothetical protein
MQSLPAAVPSAFIFVRVFVADALAAHCFVCFYYWSGFKAVKAKKQRATPPLPGTKTPAKNKCPKLYLYNASYTQPVFSVVLILVFRLPITGIMYFGLRQIAAQLARLDPEPNRKKSKQRYASSATSRPAVKKQGYINSR